MTAPVLQPLVWSQIECAEGEKWIAQRGSDLFDGIYAEAVHDANGARAKITSRDGRVEIESPALSIDAAKAACESFFGAGS